MCHNTISLQKTLYFIFSKFCVHNILEVHAPFQKDKKQGGHNETFFFFSAFVVRCPFSVLWFKSQPDKTSQNISEFSEFSDLEEFATWERYVRQAGSVNIYTKIQICNLWTREKSIFEQFRNVKDTMCCIFAFAF